MAVIAAKPPTIGVTSQGVSHGSAPCAARAAMAVPSPQGRPSPPTELNFKNHFAVSATFPQQRQVPPLAAKRQCARP